MDEDKLYTAINKLMAELGAKGEITAQHPLVSDVMNVLHEIDGGVPGSEETNEKWWWCDNCQKYVTGQEVTYEETLDPRYNVKNKTIQELDKLVSHAMEYFHVRYGITDRRQVRRADSPGYWEVLGGCPGGADCKHAFRGTVGSCDDGSRLTIHFEEHNARENGRFVSPRRAWYAWGELYG